MVDFIGGGGDGPPLTMPGLPWVGSTAGCAGLEDVEEMKAAFTARNGWRAVVGLAMHWRWS